ncbi:S24 family peptidase [Sphingomonas cannabina]|uniref:LexA family protein n=1 Tax=Sphingomonas cannabina TaxID=2899123 RepID=UPI001F46B11E|nr:S24 family peptidase [Sphingomonas cannabina]UIJ43699.1 S24 family peptidase [Sphingomonas cannabina]
MIETRGRNPVLPPTMDGGRWRLGHRRDGGGAPKSVDQVADLDVHAENYAIIAPIAQAEICDNRDCANLSTPLHGKMDLDQIRAWADAKRGRRQQIADALGITHDKVSKSLSPSGPRRFTAQEMDVVRALVSADLGLDGEAVASIPLLGSVPAGNWREAVRRSTGRIPVPDATTPPNAFALTIEGDSMDLLAPDGSTIVLDPDDLDLFPGRYYVVRNSSGETTFKQFKTDPARLVPCSTNKSHAEIFPGREQFEIVARVIAVYSRL